MFYNLKIVYLYKKHKIYGNIINFATCIKSINASIIYKCYNMFYKLTYYRLRFNLKGDVLTWMIKIIFIHLEKS